MGVLNVNNLNSQNLDGGSVSLTVAEGSANARLVAQALLKLNSQATLLGVNAYSISQAFNTDRAEILSLIHKALPKLQMTLTIDEPLTKAQWADIAYELQKYSAKEESKLASVSGNGYGNNVKGGLQTVNGHWYVNGEEVDLADLYTVVRINQLNALNSQIAYYTNLIKDNTTKLTMANAWINILQAKTPSDTSNTVSQSDMTGMVSKFKETYPNVDPVTLFIPQSKSTFNASGTKNNQTQMNAYIQEAKSYTQLIDNNNQTFQTYLEQNTNKRGEIISSLSSFTQSQAQVWHTVARNIASGG